MRLIDRWRESRLLAERRQADQQKGRDGGYVLLKSIDHGVFPVSLIPPSSELQSQRHLHVTRHVPLRGYLAEQRVVRGGVGAEEIHLVESVQRFKPKLRHHAFFDLGVLQKGEIPEIVGILPDSVEPRRKRAEVAAELLSVIFVEDAGIDPAVDSALALGQRYVVDVTRQDHVAEGEGRTALVRVNGRKLPATQHIIRRRRQLVPEFAPPSEGQLPDRGQA